MTFSVIIYRVVGEDEARLHITAWTYNLRGNEREGEEFFKVPK